jgi:hypothetical protein
MEERDNISAEIKLVAPSLEAINKAMPYDLPEGYFDLLPFQMLTKTAISVQQSAVPEGYFDSLPMLMLAKVKGLQLQDELNEIAPFLSNISREMPYSVPPGYFENLEPSVKEEAPVVPIHAQRKPWMWAVAASIITLLGVFTWQYLAHSPGQNQPVVADKIITDTSAIELAAALKKIEDTSISGELNDRGVTEDISAALFYLDTDNFEIALQDFSDEEIKTQLLTQDIPAKKS